MLANLAFGKIFGWTAAALAVLLLVQSVRLNHAKGDLEAAREAQLVPRERTAEIRELVGMPPLDPKLDPKKIPRLRWATVSVQLASNLSACRISKANLETSVGTQNEAIDRLTRERDGQKAAAAVAVKNADRVRAQVKATVASIMASKPTGADQCAAANELITKFARLPQ